jgi:hypothetical protein
VLSTEASAGLRDHLLSEIEGLRRDDELEAWTLRNWAKVNSLASADGERLRQIFASRLAEPRETDHTAPVAEAESAGDDQLRFDKSILALPEPRRLRDRDLPTLLWPNSPASSVAGNPAILIICGLRKCADWDKRSATSLRSPLCRAHHRELHRAGKEVDWWSRIGVEPLQMARSLWDASHLSSTPVREGACQ